MFRDAGRDREADIENLKEEVQGHLNTLTRTMNVWGIDYNCQYGRETLQRLMVDKGWEAHELDFTYQAEVPRTAITARFGDSRGFFPIGVKAHVGEFVLNIKTTIPA